METITGIRRSDSVRASNPQTEDRAMSNRIQGAADPVELANKFGRRAVNGARITSWTIYGLGRGDDGEADGKIRRIRGRRYVQVARTQRHYYSRDWLEEMDMFDAQPGGSYRWDGVEIEPTPDEIAADAEAGAREAAPRLLAAMLDKIRTTVASRPSWARDSTLMATWAEPYMIHTAAYATLHVGSSEVYYHVPGYFACDWNHEAVHRVAPLTPELQLQITAAVTAGLKHGLLR